ncbi:hypothetical protein ALC57_10606 [Trachymyrmex cornetzi]|uniref:Uncharacterized protein n=1 Tax=Trachymyrmex cornetzi TaxID=471704 RepID=A0A151J3V9_9HYME|nr:hypothetical protein ALC57_10606 [Trachymyrmex cornetzi]
MYASNAGTSQVVIRSTANEERSMTETKKKRTLLKRVSDASSRKPQRLGLRLLQPLCDNTRNRRARYYVASESLWLKGASAIFTLLARNILDKFNPGARQLINAGKAYLKALHAQKCAGDVECGQEGDSDPGVEEAAWKRVQG